MMLILTCIIIHSTALHKLTFQKLTTNKLLSSQQVNIHHCDVHYTELMQMAQTMINQSCRIDKAYASPKCGSKYILV